MVDVSFDNSATSTAGKLRYQTVGSKRLLYGVSDGSHGDPSAWTNETGPSVTTSAELPSIRFNGGAFKVTAWHDQSGNGHFAQSHQTYQPELIDSQVLNLHPDDAGDVIPAKVIKFPANAAVGAGNTPLTISNSEELKTQEMTVFVVSRAQTGAGFNTLLRKPSVRTTVAVDVPTIPAVPAGGWDLSYRDSRKLRFGSLDLSDQLSFESVLSTGNFDQSTKATLFSGVVGNSMRVFPNQASNGEDIQEGSWISNGAAVSGICILEVPRAFYSKAMFLLLIQEFTILIRPMSNF